MSPELQRSTTDAMQEIVQQNGEITVVPNKQYRPGELESEADNVIEEKKITFGQVTVAYPTQVGRDGQSDAVMPSDARLRNLTYACPLKVAVEVQDITRDADTGAPALLQRRDVITQQHFALHGCAHCSLHFPAAALPCITPVLQRRGCQVALPCITRGADTGALASPCITPVSNRGCQRQVALPCITRDAETGAPAAPYLTTKGYDHKTPIRTSFDQRCNRYSQLSLPQSELPHETTTSRPGTNAAPEAQTLRPALPQPCPMLATKG